MQPRHGRPGTRVVFTGKDLQSVSAVRFGGALADWEPLTVIDGQGEPLAKYVADAEPRTRASAIVDNSDPESPRRVFADSC